MLKKLSVIGVVIVVVWVSFLGIRHVYQDIRISMFGSYIHHLNKDHVRRAAWASWEMSKDHLNPYERGEYSDRLDVQEDEYQHPYRTAIHNMTDPDWLDDDDNLDSFDKILREMVWDVPEGSDVRRKVEKLYEVTRPINSINWYYACEGFTNSDGTVHEVTWKEYCKLYETWRTKSQPAERLIAQYE